MARSEGLEPQPSDPKSDALSIELRALVRDTLPPAKIEEWRSTRKRSQFSSS